VTVLTSSVAVSGVSAPHPRRAIRPADGRHPEPTASRAAGVGLIEETAKLAALMLLTRREGRPVTGGHRPAAA